MSDDHLFDGRGQNRYPAAECNTVRVVSCVCYCCDQRLDAFEYPRKCMRYVSVEITAIYANAVGEEHHQIAVRVWNWTLCRLCIIKTTIMLKANRIRQRLADLQEQWSLQNKLLGRLEKDRILETRTEEVFRLEEKINSIKSNIIEIEEEVKILDKKINPEMGFSFKKSNERKYKNWNSLSNPMVISIILIIIIAVSILMYGYLDIIVFEKKESEIPINNLFRDK